MGVFYQTSQVDQASRSDKWEIHFSDLNLIWHIPQRPRFAMRVFIWIIGGKLRKVERQDVACWTDPSDSSRAYSYSNFQGEK